MIGIGVAVALLLVGIGLALFEPWQLFVDDVVNEDIPAAEPAAPSAAPAEAPTPTSTNAPAPTPLAPVLLAQGTFISHEHATTGTVEVIQLPDGPRLLALRGLNTSNGPDLHVWLTDAPVIDGPDGWHVFDDGNYLAVGPLKGNIGDQTYEIPADADLSRFGSVTIWCDRFNVSFGAAALMNP